MRTKNNIIKLGIAVILAAFAITLHAFSDEPAKQLTANEICVDMTCRREPVKAAIAEETDGFWLRVTINGKTASVPVTKIERYEGRLLLVFAHQKGFFSVGTGDGVAFMQLEGQLITFTVVKQNFI